ncbi:MAG: RNA polymerase sigma-70 factor [Odoribacter sp.]
MSKENKDEVIYSQNNKTEFEIIFKKYYPSLLLFVERHTGDRDLSKDIVQDIFFKLYEISNQLAEDFNIKAWLYKVARNAAIDYLRHLKVIDKNELLITEAMMYSSEIDETINEKLATKIKQAINTLPKQCRIIICMNIIEGKKYTEISEELNISINTVRTQITRGYKKLREQLSNDCGSLILLFYLLKLK